MTTDTEALRRQFEAWAIYAKWPINRYPGPNGGYVMPYVASGWSGYQAGHAAGEAQGNAEVAALRRDLEALQLKFNETGLVIDAALSGRQRGDEAGLGGRMNRVRAAALGLERYEYVRRLNLNQHADLRQRNLKGERYDDMVDAGVKEWKESKC